MISHHVTSITIAYGLSVGDRVRFKQDYMHGCTTIPKDACGEIIEVFKDWVSRKKTYKVDLGDHLPEVTVPPEFVRRLPATAPTDLPPYPFGDGSGAV